ncbi:MAG TPA: acetate/propionate family kinase [Gammaproteobacteria bacterium]|nr:acetate/propionate family kinase [Gammaproteobacteria bacterium]
MHVIVQWLRPLCGRSFLHALFHDVLGAFLSDLRHILCVNSGSSSLKLSVFRFEAAREVRVLNAEAHGIGDVGGSLRLRSQDGVEEVVELRSSNYGEALAQFLASLEGNGLPPPDAIGHRLVHGGKAHREPEKITPALLGELEAVISLAPLHLPPALEAIHTCSRYFPGHAQVACFDTGFHRNLPARAQRLPLPEALWEQGVRRYGFHGLSYEYIVAELGPKASGRLVVAHLGGGASLAAILDGRSLDTTMGFTPAGGIMMGTRCGDLDPGVLVYLSRCGYDSARIERLVEREAGLLGVSGRSAEMAVLLAHREADPKAALAVDQFAYQVRKQIGAFAAVLGGLDRLVFTGGIGENAAPVRAAACAGLEFLGVQLDPDRNNVGAERISSDGAACEVLVIATDEDRMIARHTHEMLFGAG